MGVAYKNKTNSITIYLFSLPFNDKILLIPIGLEYFGLDKDLEDTWRKITALLLCEAIWDMVVGVMLTWYGSDLKMRD